MCIRDSKHAQDAQRLESERLAAEDKAKKAAEEAAAAVGLADYSVPKGGTLRVAPEALVALTKAAHTTTTSNTASNMGTTNPQSSATPSTPSPKQPTPSVSPAQPSAGAPKPQGAGAASWGAQPPSVSYTHLRAHETVLDIVCRLLLEKKKEKKKRKRKKEEKMT
eukprot:TRINITY_DN46691_c0_g1_i1.p1 TRINITY_DN46691_c0_g1~~TRINITY_DN46691_c0_g1_i1.p1  ORF type:complete len:165 (-),score=16.56 TRINITY_DN46691_c0_g1_i1:1-495(-)